MLRWEWEGVRSRLHIFSFSCLNWKLHDLHVQKWQTQKKSLFPVINQPQPARCLGLKKKRNTWDHCGVGKTFYLTAKTLFQKENKTQPWPTRIWCQPLLWHCLRYSRLSYVTIVRVWMVVSHVINKVICDSHNQKLHCLNRPLGCS